MGGGTEMCPHIYKVYSCERSEPAVQRPRPLWGTHPLIVIVIISDINSNDNCFHSHY